MKNTLWLERYRKNGMKDDEIWSIVGGKIGGLALKSYLDRHEEDFHVTIERHKKIMPIGYVECIPGGFILYEDNGPDYILKITYIALGV